MTKEVSLQGRLRMAAACPDANAPLLAEAADVIKQHEAQWLERNSGESPMTMKEFATAAWKLNFLRSPALSHRQQGEG